MCPHYTGQVYENLSIFTYRIAYKYEGCSYVLITCLVTSSHWGNKLNLLISWFTFLLKNNILCFFRHLFYFHID